MTEQERSERLDQEASPTTEGEPGRGQGMVEGGDQGQGMVGKVDRFVDRLAETMTADTSPRAPIEGRGVDPTPPATPESGRGDTLTLQGDGERRLHVGDELAVRLPAGGDGDGDGQGWTYEVEGDSEVLDISERTEVVTPEGDHVRAPGASGGSQFLLRASRQGSAVVTFQRLAQAARAEPVHLRVEVGA